MANKIKINPESGISFKGSGGDVLFTPSGLVTGQGRYSSQKDLGAPPRSSLFKWRAKTKCGANPTVGNAVNLYLIQSDGTIADGNFGTTDSGITNSNKLRNLNFIGSLVVDSGVASEPLIGGGICEIWERYTQVLWWNSTGQNLTTNHTDHEFVLTPTPEEIQD